METGSHHTDQLSLLSAARIAKGSKLGRFGKGMRTDEASHSAWRNDGNPRKKEKNNESSHIHLCKSVTCLSRRVPRFAGLPKRSTRQNAMRLSPRESYGSDQNRRCAFLQYFPRAGLWDEMSCGPAPECQGSRQPMRGGHWGRCTFRRRRWSGHLCSRLFRCAPQMQVPAHGAPISDGRSLPAVDRSNCSRGPPPHDGRSMQTFPGFGELAGQTRHGRTRVTPRWILSDGMSDERGVFCFSGTEQGDGPDALSRLCCAQEPEILFL